MIKKRYCNVDVVTMARKRIKNIFDTAKKVELSISGGKDSICLNDLVFKMCQSGEVDKSKLIVDFIDEEAIYPCVERCVKNMRTQWLAMGVEFRWWCIQVKHYSCLNMLTQDESFICWDESKKDVWIRERPKFAITSHPLLNERHDTYQSFMDKLLKDYVVMIGVRASESVQRLDNLSRRQKQDKQFPIYDWLDVDVWKYILDNGLDFPDAYKYMYQVGVSMRRMRISQFFSIDTVPSLVQVCEFYPELFDKICKREPNAYMVALYYDTEMYRSRQSRGSKKNDEEEEIDYKKKVFDTLNETWRFETQQQKDNKDRMVKVIVSTGVYLENKEYKEIYNILIGGDPKSRSSRALTKRIWQKVAQKEKMYGNK